MTEFNQYYIKCANKFREKIAALYEEYGSLKNLANACGVPLSTARAWVYGLALPRFEQIVLICTNLGVSPNWVIGLDDDELV